MVLDEVLQILPNLLAAHAPLHRKEPLSILRRKSWGRFCCREQPCHHGRGISQVFSKCCEQCCRFHRSGCDTARLLVKGGSTAVTPWGIPLPISSPGLTFTSFRIFFSCFFPPLLQSVRVSVAKETQPTKQTKNQKARIDVSIS